MQQGYQVFWHSYAWEDFLFWERKNNIASRRASKLIRAIKKTPFEGIGRPMPLQRALQGLWSRRLDRVNRLIYRVQDDSIFILSCRYH